MTPAADDELTSTQAARILNVTRPTVLAIARDRLPYRSTPGVLGGRGGRRFYKRADVERLAHELREGDLSTPPADGT